MEQFPVGQCKEYNKTHVMSVQVAGSEQFSWLCWLGVHAYNDWKEWGPRIADREAYQQGRCMRCSILKIMTQ